MRIKFSSAEESWRLVLLISAHIPELAVSGLLLQLELQESSAVPTCTQLYDPTLSVYLSLETCGFTQVGRGELTQGLEQAVQGRTVECCSFTGQGLSVLTKGWFWLIQQSTKPGAVWLLLHKQPWVLGRSLVPCVAHLQPGYLSNPSSALHNCTLLAASSC